VREKRAPRIGEQEKVLQQSLESCGNSLSAEAETPAPEEPDDGGERGGLSTFPWLPLAMVNRV
jgi:hypothetical protein